VDVDVAIEQAEQVGRGIIDPHRGDEDDLAPGAGCQQGGQRGTAGPDPASGEVDDGHRGVRTQPVGGSVHVDVEQ
jgi:hypothetical protein